MKRLLFLLSFLLLAMPAGAFPLQMVLEIASAIPASQPQEEAAPAPEPTFQLSWMEHRIATVDCYDPLSPYSPLGTPVVVTSGQKQCKGDDCTTVTVTAPVMVYPNKTTCKDDRWVPNAKTFFTREEADVFQASCKVDQCKDWKLHETTAADFYGTGVVLVADCKPGKTITVMPGNYHADADAKGVAHVVVVAQAETAPPYTINGVPINGTVSKDHAIVTVCQ